MRRSSIAPCGSIPVPTELADRSDHFHLHNIYDLAMQLYGMENDRQVIRLQLLATRAFVKSVDHWRPQHLGLPNRSERPWCWGGWSGPS